MIYHFTIPRCLTCGRWAPTRETLGTTPKPCTGHLVSRTVVTTDS